MMDDNNEEERYRQDDLRYLFWCSFFVSLNMNQNYQIYDRTKLNELKKSKDHHRDRVSSSDRDQHNKHRNSRQLQVHDYDSTYTKVSSKRDTYSTRESTRDSNQQAKHHGHHYHQTETKSYRESAEISSSSRHSSDQKRSSKISSNSSSNPDNGKHNDHRDNKKSEKYQRTKVIIEAEVNEIFSEEEERSRPRNRYSTEQYTGGEECHHNPVAANSGGERCYPDPVTADPGR
jgi:hypothetical protein